MRTWNLGKRHVFGWNPEKKLQPTASAKYGNGLTHGQGMNYEIYLQRAILQFFILRPDPSMDERSKAQKAHMWWGARTFFTRKWLSTLHSTLVTARAAHLVPQLQWALHPRIFFMMKEYQSTAHTNNDIGATIVASTSNVFLTRPMGLLDPWGKTKWHKPNFKQMKPAFEGKQFLLFCSATRQSLEQARKFIIRVTHGRPNCRGHGPWFPFWPWAQTRTSMTCPHPPFQQASQRYAQNYWIDWLTQSAPKTWALLCPVAVWLCTFASIGVGLLLPKGGSGPNMERNWRLGVAFLKIQLMSMHEIGYSNGFLKGKQWMEASAKFVCNRPKNRGHYIAEPCPFIAPALCLSTAGSVFSCIQEGHQHELQQTNHLVK